MSKEIEKFSYEISFGGGKGDGEWNAKTIIEAENIWNAVTLFEREHEGACSGWGSITVVSVVKVY